MSIFSTRACTTTAIVYDSFSYVSNLDFDGDNFIYRRATVGAGISEHDDKVVDPVLSPTSPPTASKCSLNGSPQLCDDVSRTGCLRKARLPTIRMLSMAAAHRS